MANASTTGFGLRTIKKVGQTDNVGALTEYSVAASSSALIYARKIWLQLTAELYSQQEAAATTNNLGSLNGVFYTDATQTSKPTFANYLQRQVTLLLILLHS